MDNQGKTSIYTIKKLTGAADYEEWSFSMKMLLFRDKLYGYAEGTVVQPITMWNKTKLRYPQFVLD
jgi:hypothetical protein